MAVDSTWAERALHHARHIATRIGPRGAATPEEKRAADYVQQQMQQLGLQQVRLEIFHSADLWLAGDRDCLLPGRVECLLLLGSRFI